MRFLALAMLTGLLAAVDDPAATHAWEEFRLKDGRVVQGWYDGEAGAIMVTAGGMAAGLRVRAGDIVARTPLPGPPAPPPRKERPAADPQAAQRRAAAAAKEAEQDDRAALAAAIPRYERKLAQAEEALAQARTRLDEGARALARRARDIVDEPPGDGGQQRRTAEQRLAQSLESRRMPGLRADVQEAERQVALVRQSLELMRTRAAKLAPPSADQLLGETPAAAAAPAP